MITRSFLVPGGTLVAIAIVHDSSGQPDGPPWLHPDALDALVDGLIERSRLAEEIVPTVSCVRLELVRKPS